MADHADTGGLAAQQANEDHSHERAPGESGEASDMSSSFTK
jgi:hypothetical protein